MTDATPVLNLPYILPSQAQKHVTHNEAIRLLDVIVQLSVTARSLSTPPASPAQGDRYIIPTGASGDWAGQGGKIALFENGAWQFFTPLAGWTAWVVGEQVLASYTGGAWASQADGPFNVGQLGISATPDAVNRLSVSSQATLLNHAGAGHQVKINKAAAGDTASLLFQTGFSGRAEMGTMGSDDFAVKVSADGSAFVTGLSIAADTGQVTLPAAARLGGQAADPITPPDGTIWLNSTTGEVKLRSAGATVVLAAGALGVTDGDKGDITVSAGGTVWAIDTGAVGNAKLADMPNATFKARLSAGPGAPEDITAADAASLLPVFTDSTKGLVPASAGGTTTYLRADGSWATPTTSAVTLTSLSVTATANEINRVADTPAPYAGHVLMGDPTWNMAVGAAEGSNTAFWAASETVNGVTFTRVSADTDPFTGNPRVVYDCVGTLTTSSATFGYISSASITAGLTGDIWTSSVFFDAQGPAGGGAGTAQIGAGVRVFNAQNGAGNVFGNPVAGARTLSSVTRTLTVSDTVRIGMQLVGTVGQSINARVIIEGLQLEKSAARGIGRYALLPPSSAWLLMAQPGARLGYTDGEYTAQHSVTSGIPLDNSAPLWTEGAHLISVNYVPRKIGSKLLIVASLPVVGMNTAATAIAALYINEVAVRTARFTPTNGGYEGGLSVRHVQSVASLDSIKVSLRFGPQDTGYTAFINQGLGGATMGATISTLLTVEEIAQ